MSIHFGGRTLARSQAFQLLFQAEANHLTVESLLKIMRPHPSFEEALGEALEDLAAKLNK